MYSVKKVRICMQIVTSDCEGEEALIQKNNPSPPVAELPLHMGAFDAREPATHLALLRSNPVS